VLDELPEDDVNSFLNHHNALDAKNRLKAIAGELASMTPFPLDQGS
jgi:hypothetical protein